MADDDNNSNNRCAEEWPMVGLEDKSKHRADTPSPVFSVLSISTMERNLSPLCVHRRWLLQSVNSTVHFHLSLLGCLSISIDCFNWLQCWHTHTCTTLDGWHHHHCYQEPVKASSSCLKCICAQSLLQFVLQFTWTTEPIKPMALGRNESLPLISIASPCNRFA